MTAAVSLTVVAAVASGLVAGVFFAFSTFVMRGLARPAPAVGVEAMQGVDVAALTPPFMAVLFGGPLVGVAAAVAASGGDDVHAGWAAAGAGGLLATALVTVAFHVPRNVALDGLDGPEVEHAWPRYLRSWTAGNHVRTATATLATAAFVLATVV